MFKFNDFVQISIAGHKRGIVLWKCECGCKTYWKAYSENSNTILNVKQNFLVKITPKEFIQLGPNS